MNRRAFTLVEMCVAISAGSVLLVLAMGLVQRTMRAEMTANTQADVERNAARLAQQFRDDVHHAESVAVDRFANEEVGLRLKLRGERTVAYRIEPRGAEPLSIVREEPLEEAQTRREVYAFPQDYSVKFSKLADPQRIVLAIQRNTRLVGAPPQVRLYVSAVVGQYRQLRTAEEASP